MESFDEHTVTFKLSQNMLATDGDLTFSLVLFDDNAQKSTFDSIIKVINTPEGQAAESELTAIANILSKAHEYEMLSKSYAIGTNDEVRKNDSKDNAKYYAQQAKQSELSIADNATASAENATKAEKAAANAKISESNARDSETSSAQYEQSAKGSADNAKQSETAAATCAASASEAMESAKEAKENALSNATLAANAASSAKTYRDDAKDYANQAAISAANSSTSEINAKTSEENAVISEINAAASETNAKASADHTTESAINAAASAAAAAEAAKNSSNSAETAATSAARAASSAEDAAASADNAVSTVNSAKEYAVRAEDAAKLAETIAGGDFVTKEEFAKGLAGKIDADRIGAADGLATLEENGKIPTEQLPDDVLKKKYQEFSKVMFRYGELYRNDETVNENFIDLLKTYQIAVFGSNLSVANGIAATDAYMGKLIRRLTANNETFKVYLYVSIGGSAGYNDTMENIKAKIDRICDIDGNNTSAYGVFFDEAGWDFGQDRAWQNECIDYAHEKGLSVMFNAWSVTDTFAPANIEEFKNPTGENIHLNENDYFLLESCYTGYDSECVQTQLRTPDDINRAYLYMTNYYSIYHTKLISLNYIGSAASVEQTKKMISYIIGTSFIQGISGVAINRPGEAIFDWNIPGYINDSLRKEEIIFPVKENSIINSSNEYQAIINGHVIKSINTNAPDSDIIPITDSVLEHLYLIIDGCNTQNLSLTVFNLLDEAQQFNDDANLIKSSSMKSNAGNSSKIARADHIHPAGTKIRATVDEYDNGIFEYPNYCPPLSEWEIPYYVTYTEKTDYGMAGNLEVQWGYIRLNNFDISQFVDQEIEIGFKDFVSEGVILELQNGVTNYAYGINAAPKSVCYPDSACLCARFTVTEEMVDSDGHLALSLFRISTSSTVNSDMKFSFSKAYVHKISDKPAVDDLLPNTYIGIDIQNSLPENPEANTLYITPDNIVFYNTNHKPMYQKKDGAGNIITDTYAIGKGLEFSVDENGILSVSYDDGEEETI